MPKLKGMRFATAAVERRIEDASEALRGAGVSAGAVSNPNGKAFKAVEERRRGPLARECPYACIDGVYLERSRGGSCGNVAAMVAIGVNEDGYREVVGCAESSERWRGFLSRLKSRGLRGVRMFAGDKAAGMAGPIAEAFPDAKYRRRAVRFCRNALAKAEAVADDLESMRPKEAAKVVREGFAETPAHRETPREHWRRIRTSNAAERLSREIRRRTRVVDTFPDGKSALTLVAARLKYVAASERGSRRHLDVSLLKDQSC